MRVTTIKPPQRFGIIVMGGVDVARDAVAKHIDAHRPMKDVAVNGYGNTHCTVYADQAQISAWWMASCGHWPLRPGDLCFYNGH